MKKIRLSFTLIHLWEQKRFEEAVEYYFKIKREATNPMIEGSAWDQLNEDEVIKNKKLITEFGGVTFKNPQAKLKLEIQYNDLCDLVGELDIYDSPEIIELKTGKVPSISYLSSPQLAIYALLCQRKNLLVDKIKVIHFDQVTKEFDWAFRWMHPSVIEEAGNYIDQLAPNIYTYFENQGLL